VVGGALVYDDVRNASLGGQERKRGGWMHGKGRAEGDHQIGCLGGLLCSLQFSRVECLAKADGGELQVAAADALRSPPALAEELEVRGRVAALSTALALDQRVRAMEFDQPLRRRAGQCVQPVDVLREHPDKPPDLFKLNDGPVCRVGPCFGDVFPLTDLVIPVGNSGSLGSHEFLVINRLSSLGPHALWAAEIRNATTGGNSGPP